MIFLLGLATEAVLPFCTAAAAVIGAINIGLDIFEKIERRRQTKKEG